MKKVFCILTLIVLCGAFALSGDRFMPMIDEEPRHREYALHSRKQLMIEIIHEIQETNALLRKIVRSQK